jgi:hypothetical protein
MTSPKPSNPVAWFAGGALASNVLSTALLPGPLDEDRPAITNPIARAREAGLGQEGE